MAANRLYMTLLGTALIASAASIAGATPRLQLGIRGGAYDGPAEDVVSDEDIFTLVALAHGLGQTNAIDLAHDFYLSIALTPAVGPGDENLGSFIFAGTTINVTDNMIFGTPPIAAVDGELSPHGIFETFFYEQEFQFSSADSQGDIDVEVDPHTPMIDPLTTAKDLYFKEFIIDVSGLDSSVELHFDLYHLETKNGKTKIDLNAPFSHDAGTVPGDDDPPPPGGDEDTLAPEAASFIVWSLIMGSVSLVTHRRRKNIVA